MVNSGAERVPDRHDTVLGVSSFGSAMGIGEFASVFLAQGSIHRLVCNNKSRNPLSDIGLRCEEASIVLFHDIFKVGGVNVKTGSHGGEFPG